jgi:hypothetical protein
MANCYFAKPHGMQHCYMPFLYAIDFKSACNCGEAERLIFALSEHQYLKYIRQGVGKKEPWAPKNLGEWLLV